MQIRLGISSVLFVSAVVLGTAAPALGADSCAAERGQGIQGCITNRAACTKAGGTSSSCETSFYECEDIIDQLYDECVQATPYPCDPSVDFMPNRISSRKEEGCQFNSTDSRFAALSFLSANAHQEVLVRRCLVTLFVPQCARPDLGEEIGPCVVLLRVCSSAISGDRRRARHRHLRGERRGSPGLRRSARRLGRGQRCRCDRFRHALRFPWKWLKGCAPRSGMGPW